MKELLQKATPRLKGKAGVSLVDKTPAYPSQKGTHPAILYAGVHIRPGVVPIAYTRNICYNTEPVVIILA